MTTIICLGPKACDIGEAHEVLSEPLKIKLIDLDIEGDNCYSISPQKTPEDYENNTPDLSAFLADIDDEILFIVTGECEVASCSLKILQQIKHKEITVVYLVPHKDFLTTRQLMQERVVRNVLQEYARSGLFKNIILLDSQLLESVMPPSSIKNFDSQFNLTVLNLLRTYRNIQNFESLIDHSNKPKDVSRMITFAYYDLESDSERTVYNMEMVDDKIYHFFLTEASLNSDSKMLREIKDKLKNKAVDITKISYTIDSTITEANFCFVVYHSKLIQP